jgi:uncharacterized membrane protein YphA (DoxX/SURF4 family)
MNSLTKLFLILLRVAIGWHLLFAGIAKFQPDYKGSEGYLQESIGPLAPKFHEMVGDRLADKLAADPDTSKALHDRVPTALANQWQDYVDAYAAHYNFTPEQRNNAEEKIKAIKDKAVAWMTTEKVIIKKPSQYGPPAEVEKTVPEWVKAYQSERNKLREEAAGDLHWQPTSPTLADNTRDRSADKADVALIRRELTQGLDGFTREIKDALHSELTDTQKEQKALKEPVKPTWLHMTQMDWIDFLVRWGLTISGACLILGLFTRLNCLIGALLLLSFYLAVPALPGMPEALRAEGYPYVNKNIVEMLALLTLMTTRSGRWAGVDALLYYLNPFRKKWPEPRQFWPGRSKPLPSSQSLAATGAPR